MPNAYADHCKEHDDCRACPSLAYACYQATRRKELDLYEQVFNRRLPDSHELSRTQVAELGELLEQRSYKELRARAR